MRKRSNYVHPWEGDMKTQRDCSCAKENTHIRRALCLSPSLLLSLPYFFYLFLSVCLSLSVGLSLSVCCLFPCLSFSLTLPFYLSPSASTFLSVSLCLSFLSVFLFLSLSISFSHPHLEVLSTVPEAQSAVYCPSSPAGWRDKLISGATSVRQQRL